MKQQTEFYDDCENTTKVTLFEPEKKQKVNRDFKGMWIPKNIWIDKNLSWIEKLFMVEIDSLNNENGCFASNKYLSEFFDLSTGRVSQIINDLIDKKYLSVQYEMSGKEIKKRVLRISNRYLENDEGVFRKSEGGYLENVKDNNTLINNTINNIPDKSGLPYRDFTDLLLEYGNKINSDYKIIFNDKKELKHISSLHKKFDTIDEARNYLENAINDEFICQCNMKPSILVSKFTDIQLKKNLEITEDMKVFENEVKKHFGECFTWTHTRKQKYIATSNYMKSRGMKYWSGMMIDYKDIIDKMNINFVVDNILKKEWIDKYRVETRK